VTQQPVYVSVTGAAGRYEELDALASEVGRLLAELGCVVVSGGLGGVMQAASRGARAAGRQVLGIVPGEDRRDANPHCTMVVATGVGHARNLAVAATGDVMIALGTGWGTLSEIALARKLERPVVTLWAPAGRRDRDDDARRGGRRRPRRRRLVHVCASGHGGTLHACFGSYS
jgi:uncharacterized protein (TIGR00725 family)